MSELLIPAIRQYRHNNSDDFVFGYDQDETDRTVAGLIKERDELKVFVCHMAKMVLRGCINLGDENNQEVRRLSKIGDL